MLLTIEDSLPSLEFLNPPSIENFLCTLQECRKEKDLHNAKQVHMQICLTGFEGLQVLGNYLVPMFVECSGLSVACQVFYKLDHPNEFSWTSLIQGYVEYGKSERALNMFETMQHECVPPTKYTFLASVKACARLSSFRKGQELHSHIVNVGLESDFFIGNTLVDMYARCGALVEAQEMFTKLAVRSVVSWNALISGFAGCGLNEEALLCLENMEQEGVPLNAITATCSLKACGNTGAVDGVKRIHAEVAKEGFENDFFVGSTLADAYSKCGLVAAAREVFDELPMRDVVSWTSLVAGCVENGNCEEALHCFKQMQSEGVAPNAVTYVCSLKACATLRAFNKGEDIYAEIVKEGLENDTFVSNALVDMYAKCGLFAEAWSVFDELSEPDAVLWTSLISGYAEHGLTSEVPNCLEQMHTEGLCPDAVTLVCSLKAFSSTGALDFGYLIHSEIAKRGIEKQLYVANTLMDMYTKCVSFEEACYVFDELPIRDAVSWSALITGYAALGLGEEVRFSFVQMQLDGVSADTFTFVSCLKASSNLEDLQWGREIFTEIVKLGFEEDLYVGNMLVDMYAKCNSLLEAWELFDKLLNRDIVSWNAIITGCAEHGLSEEVFSCVQHMTCEGVPPDAITFLCSLKACGSMEAIDLGQKVHSEIVMIGFEGDPFVCNSLVDMYMKCGSFAEVEDVFNELHARDVVSWNVLIAGFAEQGLCEEALRCVEQMKLEGLLMDVLTFVSVLKACTNLRAIDRGREVHAEIAIEGFETHSSIGICLVDMYAKSISLLEARDLFDTVPHLQDVVAWNALMISYSEHEESAETLSLFEQMKEQGTLPNSVTFVTILKTCGKIASLVFAKKVHAQVYRVHGYEASEVTMAMAVIDMYSNCGSLVDAQHMFDAMAVRDLAGWNALIVGYSRQGESENVFRILERMIIEGFHPDEITFLSVIKVCCHEGLISKGLNQFDAMNAMLSCAPTLKHLNCVVDLLCRAGQLVESVSVLEKLPFEPDHVVWSTILSACQKWGNMKLGRLAFVHMASLGVKHSAGFVVMSNLYADALTLQ